MLALRGLGAYRLPHLKPYALRLEALLDDAKLRETLVKFRVAREGDARLPEGARKGDDDQLWTVDDAHRAELIPLITRVLYGRFRARSGAAGGRRGAGDRDRRRGDYRCYLARGNGAVSCPTGCGFGGGDCLAREMACCCL